MTGLLRGEPKESIPGLWWKERGQVIHTPRAQTIQDLSVGLGEVAWDLLPSLEAYRAHNWQCLDDLDSRENYASLSTSLGCPHTCDFCCCICVKLFQTLSFDPP